MEFRSAELSGGCPNDAIYDSYLLGRFAVTPLLAAFKTHHHMLHILWQSNGTPRTEVVETGNADYKSLMSALEGLTGKKFRNLLAERQKLAKELSPAMDKRVALSLDHEAVVGTGGWNLEITTPYCSIGSDHGEIYFFVGEEKHPLQFLASTPVTIESKQNTLSAAEVVYGQQGGVTTISEVRLPEQVLRMAPLFLPPEAYKSVRSFYAGEQLWAHVSYEQYKGEPAFRFPVLVAITGLTPRAFSA